MQRKLTPTQIARELRKNMTSSERILWEELRNRKLGYKFARQKPIIIDRTIYPAKFYVVDFCCLQNKLIIELDGKIHETQQVEDFIREQELMKKGFRIIRFKNEDLIDIDGVLENIRKHLI